MGQDAPPFRSLTLRLLGAILLTSAFFSAFSTAIQLYVDYRGDLALLDKHVQTIRQSHLPALALAVWSVDATLIETQLHSLLSLPEIDSVELTTAYGERFSAGTEGLHAEFRDYYFELFNDEKQTYRLGSLRVRSDLTRIYQRVWDRVTVIFLTQGVRTLFVAIAILLIVQMLVTRHLQYRHCQLPQ